MRFLLDENADYELATFVRSLGHDITTIVEDYTRSTEDPDSSPLPTERTALLLPTTKILANLFFGDDCLTRASFSFS